MRIKPPNHGKAVSKLGGHPSRSNVCEVWIKEKDILKIKVTNNITYLEAKKLYEQKPEFTFSKVVQSAQVTKPETKTTETYFDEKDFNITASSKVIIPTKYKQNKQSVQHTAANKAAKSSSDSGSSKSNSQHERSRSKTRTTSRDNSKFPKTKQKEKPNVKITRLQDQSIKTDNKYGHLESMES